MGLGAHSYMDGKRFHNSYDLQKYISAKGDTSLLREDTELITETDALAEFMFLGLRLTEGVSFGHRLWEGITGAGRAGAAFARRKRCAAEQKGD